MYPDEVQHGENPDEVQHGVYPDEVKLGPDIYFSPYVNTFSLCSIFFILRIIMCTGCAGVRILRGKYHLELLLSDALFAFTLFEQDN